MVGPDADVGPRELHRQMAVAEVPGDADEVRRVMGVDVEQGLGLRDDADHAAALEQQPVAVAQPGGLRQVEQQLLPGFGPQREAAAVAAVEVDQHPAALIRFRTMTRPAAPHARAS